MSEYESTSEDSDSLLELSCVIQHSSVEVKEVPLRKRDRLCILYVVYLFFHLENETFVFHLFFIFIAKPCKLCRCKVLTN